MERRKALKVMLGAAAVAGCSERKAEADEPRNEAVAVETPPGAATPAPSYEPQSVDFDVAPLGFVWSTADPFLFCVHHLDLYPEGNEKMGPQASLAGRNIGSDFEPRDGWRMYHGEEIPGFPQHPHRGFETVTLVRKGLVDHSDSLGATARFGGGDAQWLTAGSGIQHAEMMPLVHRDAKNTLELFQIWLNLPAAKKMVPAHFTMLWANEIPQYLHTDAAGKKTEITTVAGALDTPDRGRLTPPSPPPNSRASEADADIAIWTLRMEPGAKWVLPPAEEGTSRSLYFFLGDSLRVGGRSLAPKHQASLASHHAVELDAGDAKEEVEILLLQGRPIGEPVARRGPFVMNTQGEIAQAYRDYQRTQFGGWPWPHRGPVHAREEGRFAKRPDGEIERPT